MGASGVALVGRSPEPSAHRAGKAETWARRYVPPGWHKACARLHALRVPWGNSLPNLIDDFLLLLNFIPESGQLLLMSFPVTLHLLLQSLLQPRLCCKGLMNIVSLNFDHQGNKIYDSKTGQMIIFLLQYMKYGKY